MDCTRDFKGVWIPREVYLAEDLGWTEKILLIEIDSLDNKEGCFASNDHFANFLGISKGRVSKNISALIKKGYVTSRTVYKPNSKEIDRRILHATIGYHRSCQGGIVESIEPSIDDNDQENNTRINNTRINNTRINNSRINNSCINSDIRSTYSKDTNRPINKPKEKGGIQAIIAAYTTNQELIESIRGFIQMRTAKKKPVTERALKMLLASLDKLESTDERKIKVLDQSTLNCWQGIFPLKEEKGSVRYVQNGAGDDPYNPFNI